MLDLVTTKQFERDLKRLKKRGKVLDKLWHPVDLLLLNQPLPQKYKAHPLVGNWKPCWECHIESDWLLIWVIEHQTLRLIRTGTHSDLFK